MESENLNNILKIEETTKTPYVCLDMNKGVLKISGRSYPEYAKSFYDEIYDWFDKYIENPSSKTLMEINLDYINSSSSKAILGLMKKLQNLYQKGLEVSVNWVYKSSDEDMLEVGQIFSENVNVPFHFYKY